MKHLYLLVVLFYSLLAAGPSPLLAAPTLRDIYEQHTKKGIQAFQEEHYEDAIESFRAAYAIVPKPGLLLNQGHAYMKLKKPREALAAYKKYQVQRVIDPTPDENIDEYLKEAQNLIDQQEEPPPEGWLPDGEQRTKLIVVTQKEQKKPIYKQWWLWTTLGSVVAASVVTGAVLGSRANDIPTPDAGAQIFRPTF